MSRTARRMSQSGVYHILFRGVNQQSIFEEKADYDKLKETILKVKEEMGIEIYAYCFMSNHVHIVLKEKRDRDISLIMKRILTKYARWYNIKYGRSGALIANRYKSVPVEIDEYFLHLIRYIHQNPVKAGIVEKLSEYRYSSYNEYMEENDLTDTGFILGMLNKREFEEFHTSMEEMTFRVSDRKNDTDDEVCFKIRNKYGIENPKEISNMKKEERNKILIELKQKHPIRQLQRITGVSRGIISRI